MTNQTKGEIHFEARGQTWTFKLGTNAQVLLESKTGVSMGKFISRFEDLGATELRLIFWAGLFRQHQLTEDDAGDMIDELGVERISQIFTEAVEAARDKTNAISANGAGGDARPLKPAKPQRIGMNS